MWTHQEQIFLSKSNQTMKYCSFSFTAVIIASLFLLSLLWELNIPNLTYIGPCIVIQRDSKRWTQLKSKRCLNTRQTVAIFHVLCSLYGLTCVGYAQNSLEFVSHSPLIHVVGRSFCLYTDSLFAQIGDSKDKCSSRWRLNVETKTKRTLHGSRRLSLLNSRTQNILRCI